jgi:hypothetical protein
MVCSSFVYDHIHFGEGQRKLKACERLQTLESGYSGHGYDHEIK